MCLIPKDSAKIAEEDIVVYKVLIKSSDGSYMSPFMGAVYQIGELKIANIKYDKQPLQFYHYEFYRTIITEGLHAYTTETSAVFRSFYLATKLL